MWKLIPETVCQVSPEVAWGSMLFLGHTISRLQCPPAMLSLTLKGEGWSGLKTACYFWDMLYVRCPQAVYVRPCLAPSIELVILLTLAFLRTLKYAQEDLGALGGLPKEQKTMEWSILEDRMTGWLKTWNRKTPYSNLLLHAPSSRSIKAISYHFNSYNFPQIILGTVIC